MAFPKDVEEVEPSITYIAADAIPGWKADGVLLRLLAGRFGPQVSPVPVHSDLFLLEMFVASPSWVD